MMESKIMTAFPQYNFAVAKWIEVVTIQIITSNRRKTFNSASIWTGFTTAFFSKIWIFRSKSCNFLQVQCLKKCRCCFMVCMANGMAHNNKHAAPQLFHWFSLYVSLVLGQICLHLFTLTQRDPASKVIFVASFSILTLKIPSSFSASWVVNGVIERMERVVFPPALFARRFSILSYRFQKHDMQNPTPFFYPFLLWRMSKWKGALQIFVKLKWQEKGYFFFKRWAWASCKSNPHAQKRSRVISVTPAGFAMETVSLKP